MTYVLVSTIGVLIALMIAFNGALGQHLGVFEVSFAVHAIGLTVLLVSMWIRKQSLDIRKVPPIFFLAGCLGAMLAAIDAYAVGVLGVTLAVALSTFAQLLGSVWIDGMGIGNIKRVAFNRYRIVSLSVLLCGILLMTLKY